MADFIVECYWPILTEARAADALRLIRAADPRGGSARATGCLMVPSDGLVLVLFEGRSAAAVRALAERAELPFDRIVESFRIDLAP